MTSENTMESENACLDSNKTLPMDTACLSIINEYNTNISVFSHFQQCYTCIGELLGNLLPHSNTTFEISTKYPLHTYYLGPDKDSGKIYQWCHGSYTYKQYGRYGWNLSQPHICSSIYTLYEPSNPYLPLAAALMIFVTVFIVLQTSRLIINTVKIFLNQQLSSSQDALDRLQESEATTQLLTVSKTGMRLQALDAFRGIAVLLMIFVNNGGGGYFFLNHAPWFGITIADLVLPWFAWTMGFSIVNSIRLQLRVSISRTRLISRQIKRTLILILFGLMINSMHNNSLKELRFPGVLQLLAISYFICSSTETIFTNAQRNFQFGQLAFLQDIIERWPQWIIAITLVIVHTCITFLLPIPNCPKGYLGPGGHDHYGDYMNCTAGAAGFIDRLVFGKHMYMKKKNLIFGPTLAHDPEGLMNTLSATLIVFLGVQAGRIYVTYYQSEGRIIRWKIWFLVTGLIAVNLCNFSMDEGVIPLSKNMMTLSFVLCTSSLAFFLFSMLYYIIDHKKLWSGAPFIYAGANPIFLYVGHYLTMGLFPFAFDIHESLTHSTMLVMNLWTTTVWGFIAYFMYKQEIILSI